MLLLDGQTEPYTEFPIPMRGNEHGAPQVAHTP